MNFTVNLTSLAVILWSGMLIIAGSVWVLSSQVRLLADIVASQAHRVNGSNEMIPAHNDRAGLVRNPNTYPALAIFTVTSGADEAHDQELLAS
jgi:hypothetical protein